jgi:hypothetical protein
MSDIADIKINVNAPEVGKVTLKSNGDEALSDESIKKINGDETFNVE